MIDNKNTLVNNPKTATVVIAGGGEWEGFDT